MSDDEYLPAGITLITSYNPGDQLQINGEMVEIFHVEETACGLLFTMENDKQYLASTTSHLHRGRQLRPKKPKVSHD